MWGDEESYPAVDMEVDWGGDEADKMSETSLLPMFDEEEFDWRAALRLVGMDDDYIAQYSNFPILHITREEDIAPWSPEVDSPNPFVAV